MNLDIISVENESSAANEVVKIKVLVKCNTKGYALVDNTFTASGKQSNEFRHIFLFPDLQVEVGDYIRVYTGEGKPSSVTNIGKTQTHKLYWNSDSPVWNDKEGDKATLIKFSVVDSHVVPPKKPKLPKFTSSKP